MLEQLVEKKMFMQEAKRLDIRASEQDVDQAMQAMIVRNDVTFRV